MTKVDLSVGDRVIIDAVSQQPDRPGQEAYRGPGVVDQIYPRGCFVAIPDGGFWWIPRRDWDTAVLSVEKGERP